jgi:uncharacterized protein (TIGR02246 family)
MSETSRSNTEVIDALIRAYNTQDARAFADLCSADAVHGTLHDPNAHRGREAIYRRYVELFRQYPHNRTAVVHRIAFGRFVIDHEKVQRAPDVPAFDVVAIYALANGLIERCEFVRE